MMQRAQRFWIVGQVLLGALALVSVDFLLLKFTRPAAAWLPAVLGLMYVLMLGFARAARNGAAEGGWLQALWRRADGPVLVWIAAYFGLLVVFHQSFERAGGDGREYFAQLHSIAIDRDLNFQNEAREFGAGAAAIFPFGSALLWLPFYLAAHAWIGLLNLAGANLRQEGYYYPYQMAVGLGTLTYGYAGLVLAYGVAAEYFSRWLALAATLIVCAGSFIVWYLAVDSSYTHGNSLFAVTLFLYLWRRTRGQRSAGEWAWLGAAGGLMTMVRWQNAAFLLPLAIDVSAAAWRAISGRERHRRIADLTGVSAAAAAGIAAFFPQMLFWKVVNGGWFAVPHGQAGQQWWGDSLVLDVLFSPNHGLLAWHPILYLSLLGAILFLRRDWRFGGLLLILFLAQVYINGAVTTWWGGAAFGGRRFDGAALLFVLGMTALLRWGREHATAAWAMSLGALILGNVFFMREMRSGRLTMDEAVGVERIVGAAVDRLGNPFSWPGSALFALRTGLDPASFDRLGARRYNNVRVDVGAAGDEEFLGRGWADRERNAEMSFRWALGDASTVGVALMGPRYIAPGEPYALADYVLRLRAAPFDYPGAPPQTLAVDVNGLAAGEMALAPGVREYTVAVPARLLRRSLNGIRFRYGRATSPRSVKAGDDPRPLAVLFDEIRLEQASASQ
jgi:hypothetical protein